MDKRNGEYTYKIENSMYLDLFARRALASSIPMFLSHDVFFYGLQMYCIVIRIYVNNRTWCTNSPDPLHKSWLPGNRVTF